jgi:hypothetical protein
MSSGMSAPNNTLELTNRYALGWPRVARRQLNVDVGQQRQVDRVLPAALDGRGHPPL